MTTIIKAGSAGPLLRQLSTVDLADHMAEARDVIAQVRRRAEQIEVQARQEAARVLAEAQRQGHESGFQSGYAEGLEAGRVAAHAEALERFTQEQGHVVADFQNAVAGINALKSDLRIAAERDLLDFALAVAKKLTFAVGVSHRESAVENLRRALRCVESATALSIRVHPADLETMRGTAPALLQEIGRLDSVTVVSDETLAPGGCVVQNERTRVDASLETQWDELITGLLGGLHPG